MEAIDEFLNTIEADVFCGIRKNISVSPTFSNKLCLEGCYKKIQVLNFLRNSLQVPLHKYL